MRKKYKTLFKNFFHAKLCERRLSLGITQDKMASKLNMSTRTYSDLDNGKTCCSAITLALYLTYVCEDPVQFLEELRKEFDAFSKQKAPVAEDPSSEASAKLQGDRPAEKCVQS